MIHFGLMTWIMQLTMTKHYDEITGLMIDDAPYPTTYLVAHVEGYNLRYALAEFTTKAEARRYQLREGVRAFTQIVTIPGRP